MGSIGGKGNRVVSIGDIAVNVRYSRIKNWSNNGIRKRLERDLRSGDTRKYGKAALGRLLQTDRAFGKLRHRAA